MIKNPVGVFFMRIFFSIFAETESGKRRKKVQPQLHVVGVFTENFSLAMKLPMKEKKRVGAFFIFWLVSFFSHIADTPV